MCFFFLWVSLQVHSRSCILTKETIADCFLRESNRALGHRSLSLECWSSQNASLENTNLVKKGSLALSGIYIDTPKKRAASSSFSCSLSLPLSLTVFNCSAPRLHQHFPSIWKRGIMQERQHQLIGNSPPSLLSLSLPAAEHVNLWSL